MDAHEIVSALKALALELGRTPTRREFESHTKGGAYQLGKLFGSSYSTLVQAAGLDPNKQQKRRIDNTVFERDIVEHLEKYESKEPSEPQAYPTIATISDTHFPFEKQKVIEAFYEFIGDAQPEYVILNGDAVDFYSFSRFPKSHNIFTPKEEVALARQKHEAFWKRVCELCPQAKKYNLLGNHCIRPLKQVLEHVPSAEDWIQEALKKQFTFEGVQTIQDPTEELMLSGGIMVHHGYQSRLGQHRDYAHYNAIVGHTHQGGVVYRRIRGQTLWELNSGYAADPDSKGLSYRHQKITTWTPGFGFVDAWGPRFIPID